MLHFRFTHWEKFKDSLECNLYRKCSTLLMGNFKDTYMYIVRGGCTVMVLLGRIDVYHKQTLLYIHKRRYQITSACQLCIIRSPRIHRICTQDNWCIVAEWLGSAIYSVCVCSVSFSHTRCDLILMFQCSE